MEEYCFLVSLEIGRCVCKWSHIVRYMIPLAVSSMSMTSS